MHHASKQNEIECHLLSNHEKTYDINLNWTWEIHMSYAINTEIMPRLHLEVLILFLFHLHTYKKIKGIHNTRQNMFACK